MNVEEEEGVKNYLNSPSLLQYSEKKDLEPKEDDFFARIKFRKKEENKKNDKEQKPKNSQLVETLNSMFPLNNGRRMAIDIYNMYHPNQRQEKNLVIYLKH